MNSIAVLMTCFNRKDKTLASLEAIYNQAISGNYNLVVYLVDDGSSDGTTEAVKHEFPKTVILCGNGNLYWCGGTRYAFSEALKKGYDFYLWLNDDTVLKTNALENIFNTYKEVVETKTNNVIIVGSTEDMLTGEITYGGVEKISKWHPLKFKIVQPNQITPIECDTMNGNIVLINKNVARKIGNINENFIHGMGDFDYGLRAKKSGISIWVAPKTQGYCSRNGIEGTPYDRDFPFVYRFKKLLSVKHLPLKQWREFTKLNAGKFWLIFWLSPYFGFILRELIHKKKSHF